MPSFKVSKTCLWCGKPFSWEEIIMIKAPEWACFHTECSIKFPDDNKYEWDECWIVHDFQWEETFTNEDK